MKFSELDEAGWPDLQTYLDTCLLPVTGLAGEEAPYEMAEMAMGTGDWLIPLEQTFKGRTVTMPALHYYDGSRESADKLSALTDAFRSSGFRYVVLISGRPGLLNGVAGADLVVQPGTEGEKPDSEALRKAISELWRTQGAKKSAAAGVIEGDRE